MLRELKVNNLAIIKDMQIEFSENFSVFTGETGAGKSIVLDGIAFILGARANTAAIRNNEEKLIVEAVVDLSPKLVEKLKLLEFDVDYDEMQLIIYRELSRDGKSKININGRRATKEMLSKIMSNVIDIVGQHENQYLLNHNYHLELLDGFVDFKDFNIKKIVKEIKELEIKINNLENERKIVTEKKDMYEYSINEIESLNLYSGIDDELEEQYKLIFNSGRIQEAVEKVNFEIDENILHSLSNIVKSISSISSFSSDIENIKEEFIEIENRISSLSYEVNAFSQDELNLEDLDEISDKLNKIKKCKMKYGSSIEEIISYKDNIKEKLLKLEYSFDEIEKLKKLKEKLIDNYEKESKLLSNKRKEIAKKIEDEINKELFDLNMKNASFKVEFNKKEGIFEKGIDEVEFLLKSNVGQDYAKLSKSASGGEISRIMLALKVVFSKVDDLETLIFDEIDAGISGETVKLVAEKLKKISSNVQVICVTHSPNIAASGKEQFLIYKTVENDNTTTGIKKLNYDERVNEIARIISGNNMSNALIQHVKEMISDKNE
ncbi:DNA repair protein RecN [Caviibacter abscessus]|uniref:DNA repair protein RecN n=1 Tax=Caviibacter abscessus TaxID=1766719 RepID=UPI000837BFD3|nr:DNA repair protein RecN [Caviibacter abscessus]